MRHDLLVAAIVAAGSVAVAQDQPPLLGTIPPSILDPQAASGARIRREVPADPCTEFVVQVLTEGGPCASVIESLALQVRQWRQHADDCAEHCAGLADRLARARSGDLNEDGVVDSRDVALLVEVVQSGGGTTEPRPPHQGEGGDGDGDA